MKGETLEFAMALDRLEPEDFDRVARLIRLVGKADRQTTDLVCSMMAANSGPKRPPEWRAFCDSVIDLLEARLKPRTLQ